MREAMADEIGKRARTEIVEQQRAALMRDRGEITLRNFGGEALDTVVRCMHLQDQPGFGIQSREIILQMGAVGGPDLDETRARPRHDLRHAEGAADFDQFAARNDGVLAQRKSIQHQQDGGGVVVDDCRVLGAREFADQAADMVVALAALAGLKIIFQRDRAAHGF